MFLKCLILTLVVGMSFINSISSRNPRAYHNRESFEESEMQRLYRRGLTANWRGVEPRTLARIYLRDCVDSQPTKEDLETLPEEFDSRTYWKNCPSLWEIRDQGKCLSCWAITIASVLTDRYCIRSNGTAQFRFSEEDLLSCATNETAWATNDQINGCQGGNVERAWQYLEYSNITTDQKHGLVSGGYFRSSQGCRPTTIETCDSMSSKKDVYSCLNKRDPETPECRRECQKNTGDYETDKRYVQSSCGIPNKDGKIEWIQNEILKNGPVVAVMTLYKSWSKFAPRSEDDVYVNDHRSMLNEKHAVKIVGWGVTKTVTNKLPEGTKYWIVANSFNYYWGAQRGFFKILMEDDNDDIVKNNKINDQISAGIPIIKEFSQVKVPHSSQNRPQQPFASQSDISEELSQTVFLI